GYGHSPEDVESVLPPSAEVLVAYYEAVHARTLQFIGGLDEDDLERVVDRRWDPPVTMRVRLVSVAVTRSSTPRKLPTCAGCSRPRPREGRRRRRRTRCGRPRRRRRVAARRSPPRGRCLRRAGSHWRSTTSPVEPGRARRATDVMRREVSPAPAGAGTR